MAGRRTRAGRVGGTSVVVLLACAACTDGGQEAIDATREGPERPAVADVAATPEAPPTFIDVYVYGPLDSIYNAEYERLGALCQGEGDGCWVDNLDTTAVRLAPYWHESTGGEPAGWLSARLRTDGRWPYAALVAQADDGAETTLMDLGDWGYGMTLAVQDVREERFRPWLLDELGGWLAFGEAPGFGVVDGPYGLEGRLWTFEGFETPDTGGNSVEVAAGVYMVLSVEDGFVRFRRELPQDMPCEGDVEPVPVRDEDIRTVPISALLDDSGRPRVQVAYGKGC